MDRRVFLLAGAGLALAGPALAAMPEGVRVASELANEVPDLPGLVKLGSRTPDVTLYEFFDYNCPYCKRSASHVRGIVKADRNLQYVLVNYAVLGVGSIQATKVALAFAKGRSPEAYLTFHEKLFALKGPVDGTRALGVAASLGADRNKLTALANDDGVGKEALAMAQLGNSLGFNATPSYLVGTEGFGGYIDTADKQRLVANFRKCERSTC